MANNRSEALEVAAHLGVLCPRDWVGQPPPRAAKILVVKGKLRGGVSRCGRRLGGRVGGRTSFSDLILVWNIDGPPNVFSAGLLPDPSLSYTNCSLGSGPMSDTRRWFLGPDFDETRVMMVNRL